MIDRWVPRVGFAVPSYRGAAFVAETVASALGQSGIEVRVVVGLDGPDPATEAALAPLRGDGRLRLVVRPERLGWVANTSQTLRDVLGAGATHVAVLPHDDLILPDYAVTLFRTLSARPEAAVAYSDLEMFGTMSGTLSQDSVEGARFARIATLMRDHYNAIPYRGMMSAGVARRVLPLPTNTAGDFAADTAWMFRMAQEGALCRAGQILYRKRYHATNTHADWRTPRREERVAAWAVHCRQCWDEGRAAVTTEAEDAELRDLACARLWWAPKYVGALSEDHRAILAQAEAALRDA